MHLNPVLEGLRVYPFVRLGEAKRAAAAAGVDVIDFGIGEPREETPAFIRRALHAALHAEPVSAYPTADGLPELREAIAAWVARRFGVTLAADAEVVPTLGSKEAVFGLAQVVCGRGDRVAVTTPGYPVPDRGARFAGCEVVDVPLEAQRGWLPDLDAVDWTGVRLLWLNFPSNPTGATAPVELYERAAALGRRHGFVVASDEAYSELWFGDHAPGSALQAGDPEIVAAVKRYRPNVGVAPQTFVQRAAIAAWRDEAHVEEVRARYAAKREALLPALRAAGFEPAGGEATFFLWLRLPADETDDDEAVAMRLLHERGVALAPGSYFGPAGAGYLRLALVPTRERCAEAAARLAR